MRERAREPSEFETTAVPTLTTTRRAFWRGRRSGITSDGALVERRRVEAREKRCLAAGDIVAMEDPLVLRVFLRTIPKTTARRRLCLCLLGGPSGACRLTLQ